MTTSGGFNDSDIKAFAVRPLGLPSLSLVVMTVTPVAKCPITRRSSCASIVMLVLGALTLFQQVAERASPCQCAAQFLGSGSVRVRYESSGREKIPRFRSE